MSIAALADVRLQRTEARSPSVTPRPEEPKMKAGVPVGVLNTLVQWVPTETVVGYVAIQAAMNPVRFASGRQLCTGDFTGRWQLFWLMLAFSVALVPIYTRVKANQSSTKFEWPILEMLISAAAFTLWALALQDSPFDDYCAVETWQKVAALIVGGGILGGATLALKKSPAWSDARDNNAPPSPSVH